MESVRHENSDVSTLFRGRLFTVERIQREINGLTVSRDVVRHPGAVVIVPVRDDGRIVFIRNYRVAVEQWVLELPAGTREQGEPPEATARRELIEEAGFACDSMRRLGAFYTTPGLTDEQMHVYLAELLIPTKQRLEPGEQIEVTTFPREDVPGMIQNGQLIDGKSIVALQMLALHSDQEQCGPG